MENLKDVTRLEIALAFLLMFIPLINFLIEGVWLSSISAYADAKVFVGVLQFQLGVAGSLFIYNGLGFKRHWYNVILGLALFGVAIFHYEKQPSLHYISAAVFFLGSVISVWLSSNINFRWFKTLVSCIVLTALLLHYLFDWYSLLVAEWIGIVPIATHFIIKSFYRK